jgi:CRISPR system Cascade subunit CasA
MVKKFNLVEEVWIPVANAGRVSLRQVFQDKNLRTLGGNPVQKIALLKLLLAICQRACPLADDEAWSALGAAGLADKALAYLEEQRDCFWLYGEKPFLQIPAIAAATIQPYGAVLPDIATGNTTVLTQTQRECVLSDTEKAVLVVQLMGMALGGKKTDNSVVLSAAYQQKRNEKGKPSTGKPGASSGFQGYLHNFLLGETLTETLWLNMLTLENIDALKIFSEGIGPAPWETPPAGEDDAIARALKNSLMGRLVPFSRFVLLAPDGIHYSEGIAHPNHLEFVSDPSVAIHKTDKGVKALWTDPAKRPWRNLTAMLGFLKSGTDYFDCPYLHFGINRCRNKVPRIGLWSGGLRLSSNAGEQFVSGTDDYVESEYFFQSKSFDEYLYSNLEHEMGVLDDLSRVVYSTVSGYYQEQKFNDGKIARQASELFWQLCEHKSQELIAACGEEGSAAASALRPYFLNCVQRAYEISCPKDTARQLAAWGAHYPNLGKFAVAKEKASAPLLPY